MKMRRSMRAAALSLTAALAFQTPMAAFGATPEFGRTPEEWALLRDNVLEYGEIEDLIHEYNVTVQNNERRWKRDDKGQTASDSVGEYLAVAGDSYDAAGAASTDLERIGYEVAAKNAEQQAQSAAENAVDDSTKKLDNELTEKKLVMQAQTAMNTWYQLQYQLTALQKNRELLEALVTSAQNRQSIGMATQADVLAAQQNLQNADAQIIALQSQIEDTRQTLIVMLGWKQDAQPEICPMPAADPGRIASIDVAADTQKALENDYTLRVDRRKLNNSMSDSGRKINTQTVYSDEQNVAAAVNTAYQSLLTAKISLDEASVNHAAAQNSWATAQTQYGLGVISPLEYLQAESAAVTAQTGLEIANLKFLQAMETYDWTVKGVR